MIKYTIDPSELASPDVPSKKSTPSPHHTKKRYKLNTQLKNTVPNNHIPSPPMPPLVLCIGPPFPLALSQRGSLSFMDTFPSRIIGAREEVGSRRRDEANDKQRNAFHENSNNILKENAKEENSQVVEELGEGEEEESEESNSEEDVNLKKRKRRKSGTGDIPCKLCGKLYFQQSSLLRHMRSHNNTHPFRCQICDRGILGRAALKNHENSHKGEKGFICSNINGRRRGCGKQFKKKEELIEHLNVKSCKAFKVKLKNKGTLLPLRSPRPSSRSHILVSPCTEIVYTRKQSPYSLPNDHKQRIPKDNEVFKEYYCRDHKGYFTAKSIRVNSKGQTCIEHMCPIVRISFFSCF